MSKTNLLPNRSDKRTQLTKDDAKHNRVENNIDKFFKGLVNLSTKL